MGFVNPILGGGGALVRPAIKSPNYVAGVSGWTINRAGNAEFNDLDLRGVFTGTDYVVNEAGVFLYGGAPALGNMTGSWAAAAGTDAYGNAYPQGLALYDGAGTLTDLLGGPNNVIYNIAGTETVAFWAGNLLLSADGNPISTRAGSLGVLGDGTGATMASPVTASLTHPASQTWRAGSTATLGAAGSPHYELDSDTWTLGTSIKASLSGGVWTPETSQHISPYAANWAAKDNGGLFPELTYRLNDQDELVLSGVVHSTVARAAGTYTLNSSAILSKFRPTTDQRLPGGEHTTSGNVWNAQVLVTVTATGNINVTTSAAIAAGDNFYLRVSVPLGHVA